MFERAQAIRNSFFRGSKSPYVGFELTPVSMDASINQFSMTVDGQVVTYRHGPPQPKLMEWPGPDGGGRVQLDMQPMVGTSMLTERGPWAWFRVLDRANLQPSGRAERFLADFRVGDRSARYELIARSAYNPFKLDELHAFRCVQKLTR
jgi:type VI secretion system protein ImpL